MKKKNIKIGILIIATIILLNHLSFAYNWNGKHRPNTQAIFYAVGNSNFWNEAFIQALGSWNELSNFEYYYYNERSNSCDLNFRNGWGFSHIACGTSLDGAAAITISWVDSDKHIADTDIIFNAKLYWNVYSGKMNWYSSGERVLDFRRVAVHELGHALGLSDQYTSNYIGTSVMYGYVNDNQPETPQVDDINGIQAIYGGGPSIASGGVGAFVTRFYQQCLGREPDAPGLEGWVNALITGTLCGADVANGFIFSQEFINRNTSNETFVTILYRAFFGREPDTNGYNGWVNYLYSGATRQDVLNGFIYSQEFNNLCANYGISPVCSVTTTPTTTTTTTTTTDSVTTTTRIER